MDLMCLLFEKCAVKGKRSVTLFSLRMCLHCRSLKRYLLFVCSITAVLYTLTELNCESLGVALLTYDHSKHGSVYYVTFTWTLPQAEFRVPAPLGVVCKQEACVLQEKSVNLFLCACVFSPSALTVFGLKTGFCDRIVAATAASLLHVDQCLGGNNL